MPTVNKLLVFISVLLGSLSVQGIDVCKEGQKLYLLPEGDIVSWARSFTGLQIRGCVNINSLPIEELDTTALATLLGDVAKLSIWNVNTWSMFPETLENIRLSDVHSVSKIDSCSKLTSIKISFGYPTWFSRPQGWLARCDRLRTMKLHGFRAETARALIDEAPPSLRRLEIVRLEDLATLVNHPIFPTPSRREQSIEELEIFGLGEDLITESDKTTWPELSAAIAEQLATLPSLRTLSIIDIWNFDFCPQGEYPRVIFKSLRSLTLMFTNTTRACFRKLRALPQVEYITFDDHRSDHHKFQLKLKEFFTVPTPMITVDFQGMKIENLQIEKRDLSKLDQGSRKANLTFLNMEASVECGKCQNGLLARALREGLVTAPGIACTDGRRPGQLQEWLECDRINCSSSCNCGRDWARDVAVADCREAGLTALPADLLESNNIKELLASNNKITELPQRLPSYLQLLDLSNNALKPLSVSDVSALFSPLNMRVRLAGNPLICLCDYQPGLLALQQHRHQIEDYENLICVNSNMKLKDVDLNMLCV